MSMGVIINEIKDKYEILLHKVNEETIGSIPMDFLINIILIKSIKRKWNIHCITKLKMKE